MQARTLAHTPALKREALTWASIAQGTPRASEHSFEFLARMAARYGDDVGLLVSGYLFTLVNDNTRKRKPATGGRASAMARVSTKAAGLTDDESSIVNNQCGELRNAAASELGKVWRTIALVFHPDRHKEDVDKANRIFSAIGKCYEQQRKMVPRGGKDQHSHGPTSPTPEEVDQDPERFIRMAMVGLILARVVAAGVYRYWWLPRQRRRQLELTKPSWSIRDGGVGGNGKTLSHFPVWLVASDQLPTLSRGGVHRISHDAYLLAQSEMAHLVSEAAASIKPHHYHDLEEAKHTVAALHSRDAETTGLKLRNTVHRFTRWLWGYIEQGWKYLRRLREFLY